MNREQRRHPQSPVWATIDQALDARPWLVSTPRDGEPPTPEQRRRFVRRLIDERVIGYSKVGGRVVVDLNEIDELAERGRVSSRAGAGAPSLRSVK